MSQYNFYLVDKNKFTNDISTKPLNQLAVEFGENADNDFVSEIGKTN